MTEESKDGLTTPRTEDRQNAIPSEVYRMKKTQAELDCVYRVVTQKSKRTVLIAACILWGVTLWTMIADYTSNAAAVYFGMALAFSLMQAKAFHDIKKRWRGDYGRISQCNYQIEIFEDGYRVTVEREGREVNRTFSPFDAVTEAWDTPEYLIFGDGKLVDYLRKREIAADSRLYTALAPKLKSVKTKTVASAETPREPVPTDISDNGIGQRISTGNPAELPRKPASIGMLTKVSKLFVVLTGLAIGAAFMLLPSMLWETHDLVLPGYALLLIFPVVCLILGILLSRRGGKGKGAVDLGIVGGLIIAVVGVCVFLLSDTVNRNMNEDPTFVSEVTAQVGVTLPAGAETVYTMVYDAATTDPDAPTRLLRSADIALRGTAWTEFETQLAADGRWQQNLPTAQRGLLPNLAVYDLSHTTYVLIRRADGAVPNAAPETAGTYRYLCLLYEPSNRELNIYEYELDYIP